MATYKAPLLRDMQFVLNEVLDVENPGWPAGLRRSNSGRNGSIIWKPAPSLPKTNWLR